MIDISISNVFIYTHILLFPCYLPSWGQPFNYNTTNTSLPLLLYHTTNLCTFFNKQTLITITLHHEIFFVWFKSHVIFFIQNHFCISTFISKVRISPDEQNQNIDSQQLPLSFQPWTSSTCCIKWLEHLFGKTILNSHCLKHLVISICFHLKANF